MKNLRKIIAVLFAAIVMMSCAVIPSYAKGQTRYSVLVLDVSGSMSGEPLECVKAASKKFVDYVLNNPNGDNNYIAIVSFETRSRIVSEFSNDKAALNTAIDSLDDMGMTNLAAGINSAAELLNNVDPNAIKNMFIMCDGYPNEGSPDGKTAAYNAVAALPQNWNVVSMYFNGGHNYPEAEEVMRNVGRNGFYGPIDDVNNIDYIFAEVWSTQATTNTVNRTVIIIACPVDVSVELNGVVLDKDNPKTLFGTLEFEGPEDDQTKILTLSYRDDYVIKVVGTGTGTMDYSITYYCNDEELYSLSYPTIDITPQTIINGKVNYEDREIKLELDKDGDGVIDSLVSPGRGGSGGFFKRLGAFIKKIFIEFWEHIVRLADINIDFLED